MRSLKVNENMDGT